jgi:hypothetical protein
MLPKEVTMVRRLWIKLLGLFKRKKKNRILLSDILSSLEGRETLLGMLRIEPPNPDQIILDAQKIVRYAESHDYSVWANEVWSMTLDSIDKLTEKNLSDHEIEFLRGELSQNLKLLRLSYKAFEFKKENSNPPPQGVKGRSI